MDLDTSYPKRVSLLPKVTAFILVLYSLDCSPFYTIATMNVIEICINVNVPFPFV